RIRRVRLVNFRGIEEADLEFDADGVTIIEGPNEAGKSSVAEAIRLIRGYRDTSRAKEVLDVQPVGTDVGPRIEIEVTTGGYHFVYRQQFVKKPSTERDLLAPRTEQVTGRQAHDKVESIFAETLDPQLWDALQMVQGESFQQPALARIAPLCTSLSEAGGEPGRVGEHQPLLDRIERGYARDYTPGGNGR